MCLLQKQKHRVLRVRHFASRRLSTVTEAPTTRTVFPNDTTVLYFSNHFPEPKVSAAGVRTTFLLEQLAQSSGVSKVHYCIGGSMQPVATDPTKQHLEYLSTDHGIEFHHVPPNNSGLLHELLDSTTRATHHSNVLVIYDRFYTEEMYSFVIHQHVPHATCILDMQDWHSLRRARQRRQQEKYKKGEHLETQAEEQTLHDSLADLPINLVPSAQDSHWMRELSSMHRSDMVLVCSRHEMKHILLQQPSFPSRKLCLAPLFGAPSPSCEQKNQFETRKDFCFVGGFRHEPNVDAVRVLVTRIWPKIKERYEESLDNVKLHIYGGGMPGKLKTVDSGSVIYHGLVEQEIHNVLSRHRVLLAPIRFGAGIKGKIVDAFKSGTAVVTTPIGSEGLVNLEKDDEHGNPDSRQHEDTNAYWMDCRSENAFVRSAADLYTRQDVWGQAVNQGLELLPQVCGTCAEWKRLSRQIVEYMEKRETHRSQDYIQAILWQGKAQYTKYFSKYIECKKNNTQAEISKTAVCK